MADPILPDSVRAWPTCPRCGAKRVTRCPFCNTSGIEFAPAQVDFGRLLDLPANGTSGSCCGPGGCSPVKEIAQSEELHELDGPSGTAASAHGPMLLCPTCDEPFWPQFAGRCHCGQEFLDGFEQSQVESAVDGMNPRVLVCLGGIILFAVAVLAYLYLLF